MITIRKSEDRGHMKIAWLNSRHSFSFGDYYDPAHMGFRSLRVINQDIVQPATGFDTHPHRDMEIITYVTKGTITHKDSMGNSGEVKEGEIQRMTAGTGVLHSEHNRSEDVPLEVLQIWVIPDSRGLTPSYEQIPVELDSKKDQLKLLASPSGTEGSVTIHQSIWLFASKLSAQKTIQHPLEESRHAWIQIISGRIILNGNELKAGDGASASDEDLLKIQAMEDSEFLLFDLN